MALHTSADADESRTAVFRKSASDQLVKLWKRGGD